MKKIIIGSLLVVGLVAGYAFAHGNGYGYMGGNGNQMMGQMDQDDSAMMNRGGRHMMGRGMGMMQGGMMNPDCPRAGWFSGNNNPQLSAEQYQSFLDATTSLRKQMHDKRFELMEARRKPATSPAQLAEIEKQIIDIRAQIDEQALLLRQPAN